MARLRGFLDPIPDSDRRPSATPRPRALSGAWSAAKPCTDGGTAVLQEQTVLMKIQPGRSSMGRAGGREAAPVAIITR